MLRSQQFSFDFSKTVGTSRLKKKGEAKVEKQKMKRKQTICDVSGGSTFRIHTGCVMRLLFMTNDVYEYEGGVKCDLQWLGQWLEKLPTE